MSFIEGMFIFFAILFGYFLLVYVLNISGRLKKYNISFYGPALLMRTTKGIGFLKKSQTKKDSGKLMEVLELFFVLLQ